MHIYNKNRKKANNNLINLLKNYVLYSRITEFDDEISTFAERVHLGGSAYLKIKAKKINKSTVLDRNVAGYETFHLRLI